MLLRYLSFCFGFSFFVIVLYINALVEVWNDRRFRNSTVTRWDLGHQFLPEWNQRAVNTYYILAAFLSVIVRYVFHGETRLMILRRWFFLQGLVLVVRSIGLCFTSISLTLPSCQNTANDLLWIEAFYVMLFIRSTCTNTLVSTHTIILTSCALAWTTYSKGEEYVLVRWCFQNSRRKPSFCLYPKQNAAGEPVSLYITSILVWLFTIGGYVIQISTRSQYTVNVFFGFLISWLIWTWYHCYIKTLTERHNLIITRFLLFFERNEKKSMTNPTNVFPRIETDFQDAGSELDMTIYASAISSD